jgi:hypothetical protein
MAEGIDFLFWLAIIVLQSLRREAAAHEHAPIIPGAKVVSSLDLRALRNCAQTLDLSTG